MKLTAKLIQRHLRKGGKIRRACWQVGLHLELVSPRCEELQTSFLFPNKHGTPELWAPSYKQLNATDWEKIPMETP